MLKRLSMAVAALTARSKRPRHAPPLWIFSDLRRLPDASVLLPHMRLAAGIVIRHTDRGQREELLRRALHQRRSPHVRILVSQDWRLAAALRADGVHVPEADGNLLPIGLRLWRRLGRRLITTSAHTEQNVRRAAHLQPDVIFVSPIFPTTSHIGRKPLGTMSLSGMCRRSRFAIGALGGVTQQSIFALRPTHVGVVAGISFALAET